MKISIIEERYGTHYARIKLDYREAKLITSAAVKLEGTLADGLTATQSDEMPTRGSKYRPVCIASRAPDGGISIRASSKHIGEALLKQMKGYRTERPFTAEWIDCEPSGFMIMPVEFGMLELVSADRRRIYANGRSAVRRAAPVAEPKAVAPQDEFIPAMALRAIKARLDKVFDDVGRRYLSGDTDSGVAAFTGYSPTMVKKVREILYGELIDPALVELKKDLTSLQGQLEGLAKKIHSYETNR
jgi:hypothetical protein